MINVKLIKSIRKKRITQSYFKLGMMRDLTEIIKEFSIK